MSLISFKYDYKNGELVKGQALMDTDKLRIVGRVMRQVIEVTNREDRTDGLKGGGIEMLIVVHDGNEYGSIDMELEEIEACVCSTHPACLTGICLDGCLVKLNACCLTLN